MISVPKVIVFTYLGILLLLSGCQPKVYLMPPPVGLKAASKFFEMTDDSRDENLLYTLYATNRQPFDRPNGNIGYTIFPSDDLRLGFVVHSVGDEGTSWQALRAQSSKDKRDNDLLIKQIYVRPRTEYRKEDDITKTSSKGEGFFDRINTLLETSFDKDLLVYVHGANSNFYRATAQGAQIFHFTGHNTIVLSFSWPSAENIFKYKTDVLHAKKTVPAFARLLEILANHTNARNINILTYSAGTQVTVPGLAYLRSQYPELSSRELKNKFRIGEVYFAAPDMNFNTFVDQYLEFKDIVGRTTINLNRYDKVLRLAAYQNGVSRLGRPNLKDITVEEGQILIEATKSPKLNILNVGDSKALKVGGAHDSWYNHPWVSNDLLLLLLFNANPEERGLQKYISKNGAESYFFPDDYDKKILKIIRKGVGKTPRKSLEKRALPYEF